MPMAGLPYAYPETGYDYYVSSSKGKDTYDGTMPTRPFKTLDKALSVATNDQSIGILSGEYAFPTFYANTGSGASKRLDLVGINGARNTFIRKSLTEDENNCRIVGLLNFSTYPTMSGFYGITFDGCRPYGRGTARGLFRAAVFQDCEFINGVCTNGLRTWAFLQCVLQRPIIRNYVFHGDGGDGSEVTTPVAIGFCDIYEGSIEFNGGGSIAFLEGCSINNTYFNGHYLNSLFSSYDAGISWKTILEGCVVAVDNVQKNFMTTSVQPQFIDCLVGVDRIMSFAPYNPTSVLTNYSMVATYAARGIETRSMDIGNTARDSGEEQDNGTLTWPKYKESLLKKCQGRQCRRMTGSRSGFPVILK